MNYNRQCSVYEFEIVVVQYVALTVLYCAMSSVEGGNGPLALNGSVGGSSFKRSSSVDDAIPSLPVLNSSSVFLDESEVFFSTCARAGSSCRGRSASKQDSVRFA